MRNKQKILIADDSEMNRAILTEMLDAEYEIIEAEDGIEAVAALQKYGTGLSLVLLDIVMPKLDGFGVLMVMDQHRWIDDIPVIMISAENSSVQIERSYDLGVTDFINRPFDARVVHRRVVNTLLLYSKQKRLIDLVSEQIYEKEKQSSLMVDILSHIVEFRNGESGLHVLHIRVLTELFLKQLVTMTDKYPLSQTDISMISTASALHDIGKISISGKILNKPGRLTEEEFAVMKTHSAIGAEILQQLPFHQNSPQVKTAYEICRWHHERYDGRGYPDGLKGDEIPISAQVVALADVYDALTSERVYKKAIPHEEAVRMILDGQCGAFNPLVLECLTAISESLPEELKQDTVRMDPEGVKELTEELLRRHEITSSERTLQLLEHERMKYSFFASLSEEIQFEYTEVPSMLSLSSWGAERLGLPETIMDPMHDDQVCSLTDMEQIEKLRELLRATTPQEPNVQYECKLSMGGLERWMRFICRAIWSTDLPPQYMGAFGKTVDIHEQRLRIEHLEHEVAHDMLTGLLNHKHARKRIVSQMKDDPGAKFALAVLDLDDFKSANDTYGHMFGDEVLKYSASQLKSSVRGDDIVARIGGDEFLIFLKYETDLQAIMDRIFHSLLGTYKEFPISFSMGVAQTEIAGTGYPGLFQAADHALYTIKRSGSGRYCFYDTSMQEGNVTFSMIDKVYEEDNRDGE